jgi:hypothetical protein
MPLLLYFPLIIWMGMFEVARSEIRSPAEVKVRVPTRR